MKIDSQKISDLEAWNALFTDPQFLVGSAEDRYDARLALADDMKAQGVIDADEWAELVEEASAEYAEEVSDINPPVR
ncbi:hypothetical protein NJH83_30300 [Pseudomonas chlororaphis]|uniref:hypothetical protein n=1 Tax=Pseudomonas chlororaphis TaxID=587753 RepID=UPI00209AFB55|nr:hypothetical protein [Pseudomonas chlororaphis]MCO7614534.1 hypothetical protein [Pseudomonas chlororaphis]